jgi:hypothetical protein
MEQRKSDRAAKRVEVVSCSDELSPDEKSEAGDGEEVIRVKIPALDKYNLRTKSIQNRMELEKKKKAPVKKKEPKANQRPVPLSKYRRRTANARERERMQVTHHNSCSYVIPWIHVSNRWEIRETGFCREKKKSSSSVNLPFVSRRSSSSYTMLTDSE